MMLKQSDYEYYCPRCGDTHFISNDKYKCVVCGEKMIETPHEYNLSQQLMDEILKMGWNDNKHIYKNNEKRFFDEVVSKAPEFDSYLHEHRREILQEKENIYKAQIAHGKAILEGKNKVPKCITCGSTNIRKIGSLERGASIIGLGIFSRKINKTFKCNNCGCTW